MHFLCLHGAGTNNKIFEAQTARLRLKLGDEHTFYFCQGWIGCRPAEGVVEVFGSLPCVRYLEPSSPASVVAAVDRLQACIDAHGPFDGVIGFSEGASLAASLIAREAADPSSTRLQPAFACALFLSGGVPFDYGAAVEGKARHLSTEADGEPVAVPSVNVWGRNDTEHPDTSTVLARLCQREGRVEVVHNGRHELPASRDPEFAAMVRAFQDVMERTGVAIPYA